MATIEVDHETIHAFGVAILEACNLLGQSTNRAHVSLHDDILKVVEQQMKNYCCYKHEGLEIIAKLRANSQVNPVRPSMESYKPSPVCSG